MITIATWNVQNHGIRTWEQVVSAVHADIALFQECPDPGANLPDIRWERNDTGKGVAIYTRGLQIDSKPFGKYQGWVQIADVTLRKGVVVRLINIHGRTNVKPSSAFTKLMNDILYDLKPWMHERDHILLGGDLNMSILFRPRDGRFLGRLEDEFGLVNCIKRCFPDEPEPRTIRRLRGGVLCKAYQDDYLFASQTLAKRLTEAKVYDDSAVEEIKSSEHNAVSATFRGL
jgi:exonuclease III